MVHTHLGSVRILGCTDSGQRDGQTEIEREERGKEEDEREGERDRVNVSKHGYGHTT